MSSVSVRGPVIALLPGDLGKQAEINQPLHQLIGPRECKLGPYQYFVVHPNRRPRWQRLGNKQSIASAPSRSTRQT